MDMSDTAEPEPVRAAPSQRKRRRPALSCAECRRRKIKCDRNIPCTPCKLAKSATCTYSPEGLARKGHGVLHDVSSTTTSTAHPSLDHNHSPDNLFDILNLNKVRLDFNDITHGSDLDHQTSEHQHTSPTQSTSSSRGGHDVKGLLDRVQKLESMLASASIGQRTKPQRFSHDPAKDLRGSLVKTRWFGPSHWMHAFVQTRRIICFEFNVTNSHDIVLTDKTADKEINALVEKCKSIARVIKAAQVPQWTLWGTTYKHTIPPRDVADRLVANYFRTHEATHRILHIPSFIKEYNQFIDSPHTASSVSSVKVMLVMAIGTCFCPKDKFKALRQDAIQWIYAAQSWLASPDEKARLHMSLIQIQCLALLARPIFSVSGDLVWITIGTVIRTAMQMGLHRDPIHFPRISPFHGEIRRRLWATIMEFNVTSSLETGMVPMVATDQYDTEPPANIDDEDISEATIARPVSKPRDVFTRASIQCLIVQSFATRLEVAQLINHIQFEPSYDEILRIGTLLMKSYKENHTFITHARETVPNNAYRPTAFHRKVLDLSTQQFLLALHRPFALMARNDPRFYYSHKVYVECALAVMSYNDIGAPSASPPLNNGDFEDDYTRLRVASGGYLKDIIIHATLVIYLELIIPLDEDPSLSFTQDCIPQRSPFRKFLGDALELSKVRLELSETNIKGHLMFSIALAHVDAMEQGISGEQNVINAARESLRLSEKLLTERLPKSDEQILQDANASMGEQQFSQQDVDMAMQDWGMMDYGEDGSNDYWFFPPWNENPSFVNGGRQDAGL